LQRDVEGNKNVQVLVSMRHRPSVTLLQEGNDKVLPTSVINLKTQH